MMRLTRVCGRGVRVALASAIRSTTRSGYSPSAVCSRSRSGSCRRFGCWNVHGGADVLVFGATTTLLNVNAAGEVKKSQVAGLVGIGLRY